MIVHLLQAAVWLGICRTIWFEYQGQRRDESQKQIDALAKEARRCTR